MNNHTVKTIREYGDGIYRIQSTLPYSTLKTINAYILTGPERNILIDTGYNIRSCRETLRSAFACLNVEFKDTDIILTHCHDDHSGAATELLSDNRHIFYPAKDHDYFGIGKGKDVYREMRRPRYILEGMHSEQFDNIMHVKRSGSIGPNLFCSAFCPVHDNFTISTGRHNIAAVSTPGHSPGHMCFWEAKEGILFTGDHLLFDISPNIIVWPGINDILGLYLESLNKISYFNVKLALPGHREPGDFKCRIQEQFQHHNDRLSECEKIIESEPGLNAMQITERMKWNVRNEDGIKKLPDSLKRYAFGEALAHIDHLIVQGRVVKKFKLGSYCYMKDMRTCK